jgi:phosphoribosylamine--glycine ligase
MKLLVIGSGGREHAMIWKLAQSKNVEKIWAAPGNGGTAGEAKTENFTNDGLDPSSEEGQKALLEFAKTEKIDLAVVGPEAPLAAGIVDRFRAEGLAIVGPDKKAARLESSKVYSKSFMEKYGVRAAKSKSFTDPAKALAWAEEHFGKKPKGAKKGAAPEEVPSAPPLVIKADGLAAGKGVVIARDLAQAKECIVSFMKGGALGEAGKSVVIEEFLRGKEVSVLAAVSVAPGKKGVIRPFLPARDHKRRFDGGEGPNTGGMGAIAPVPDFVPAAQKDFVASILGPTLKGMEAEKMDYRGFIFFGLMVYEDTCYLLEYNVRLGDPETQAVLPLMNSDFAALCSTILDGSLSSFPIKWKNEFACAPVAVAEGYPGAYRKDDPIAVNPGGLERTGAKLFIAGAHKGQGGALGSGLRTQGGRVLAASARAASPEEARTKAYEALGFVGFEGMDYRKDIGKEADKP